MSTAVAGQYHFYVQTLWRGAATYTSQVFPLSVEGAPELKLVLALAAYSMAGIAAFFALGLRKALPAVVVLLVLVGFSLTVDDVTRVVWVPVLFLVLSACVLATSRALKRTGGRITDILIGGAVGLLATVLGFYLTLDDAGRCLQTLARLANLGTPGIEFGLRLQLAAELPPPAGPGKQRGRYAGQVTHPHVLAGERS